MPFPIPTRLTRRIALAALLVLFCPAISRAEEHITLTTGLELDCIRRELLPDPSQVRLHTGPSTYLDVPTASIRLIESIEHTTAPQGPLPRPAATDIPTASIRLIESIEHTTAPQGPLPRPAATDIPTLLANAATSHRIDVDLLTSLVHAESAFHPQAVSRAGARGLMQLMPATAASLGVHDALRPDENIAGGTTYLDQLLTRFHDDIALALAAYNAGPAAVDRYHGIPPYRETRAYVARILTEYNRKKLASSPTRNHLR